MIEDFDKTFLNMAHKYAENHSTCAKVHVGSVIRVKDGGKYIFGCNHGCMNCRKNGCRRIKLYGENSKAHRLPSDCDAIHSEVDAICKAALNGVNLKGSTIYVTRYPCEACARAIVASGIKKVVYGRTENISDYTSKILESADIEVKKKEDWIKEDDNA